jgi:hypothetical protein
MIEAIDAQIALLEHELRRLTCRETRCRALMGQQRPFRSIPSSVTTGSQIADRAAHEIDQVLARDRHELARHDRLASRPGDRIDFGADELAGCARTVDGPSEPQGGSLLELLAVVAVDQIEHYDRLPAMRALKPSEREALYLKRLGYSSTRPRAPVESSPPLAPRAWCPGRS